MNTSKIITLLILALILTACNTKKEKPVDANLEIIMPNDVLGQKPPGMVPEAFAPGLVTTPGWETGVAFTPDMQEFYFIREVIMDTNNSKQEFVVFKNTGNEWKESIVSDRVGQPYISPDGNTMHLGRRFKQRTQTGWSDIKPLGMPFDSLRIMRLTASAKGTYFFDEFKRDYTGDIRYSEVIDGQRQAPKLAGKNINAGKSFHPFIAPDESYLIFDATRGGGYGDSDIYISFKQADGSWGTAINLGDKINTPAWEAAATVTPDGKYLFFNRNIGSKDYENVDIMWVDAGFIAKLKPN
ncbi:MAG: hypothetical protein ABJM06_07015 [Gilvibacter sp.]